MNFWETETQEHIFAIADSELNQFGDRMWIDWAREMVTLSNAGKCPAVAPMLMKSFPLKEILRAMRA